MHRKNLLWFFFSTGLDIDGKMPLAYGVLTPLNENDLNFIFFSEILVVG